MASQPEDQCSLGCRGPPTTGSSRTPNPRPQSSAHTLQAQQSLLGPDARGSTLIRVLPCSLPAAPTPLGQGLLQQAPPAPHATGTNSVDPSLEGEATQILQLELLQRSPVSNLKPQHGSSHNTPG